MSKLSFYDIKRIIKPYQTAIPTDDFRIIDSWTEFEEDDKVPVEERALKYLCYELETVNPDTGERHHFFKALQFVRVRRLPKGAKQSLAFMDMQTQILSGIYESEINLVTIIANVKKPVPLGLLFLYGVQGIGNTIDEAKEQAHYDFLSVIGMLQATFRVLELKIINAQETEWLRSKMYGMDFMTVVRGIPKASQGGEDAGNKGFGGANLNPNSQGTLEELIIGLVDYEYVLEVISTPVQMNTLKAWSIKTQTEMTDWYTQLQGQTSLSANISIPMMYGANSGTSSGWSQAYTDAESINYSQSESFTNTTGESLSQSLSQSFGTSEGVSSGISHSVSNGSTYSISNGVTNGITEGITNGITEGVSYGLTKGVTSGNTEGLTSGITNGTTSGLTSGITNGTTNGITKGITNGTTEGVTNGTTEGNTLGISQTNGVKYSVATKRCSQDRHAGNNTGKSIVTGD